MDGGIPTLTLMFFIGGKQYSRGSEAALSWRRSYVLVGSKLCSRGVEAMFPWSRSYVPNVVTL